MSERERERDLAWYLTHPVAVLGLVGGVLQPELVFGLLTSAGQLAATWFPLVATLQGLPGVFGFLPAQLLNKIFVVLAVLYVGYLAYKAVGKTTDKLS